MSWWKDPVVAEPVEVEKPAPAPRPERVPSSRIPQPNLGVDELSEYMAVAQTVGLESQPALMNERIKRFLHENEIHAYDSVQVVEYLNDKLGEDWVWQGLRQTDVEHLEGWIAHHGDYRIKFGRQRYLEAVPFPVLLTVQKIAKEFPDLHFYVSAPKEGTGDPFLMVTARTLSNFIVERWDEPSFRERS